MAKLKRAERRAANRARWAMVNAMREAAFRACAGEPVPPGVSAQAWEMLAAGATATPDDLHMPGLDGLNAAMVEALDQFLSPRKADGKSKPEDAD